MEGTFGTLRAAACVALVLVASLGACSDKDLLKDKYFVGKWQSSKASAPIRMDANGEWELLTKEGDSVQYGVWQYFDNKVMWSIMEDRNMGHEINPILSASAREFKLREANGSVTTFTRLD